MSDNDSKIEEDGDVATLAKPKVKKPSMYQVLMINDDYTTMDFVIHVLKKFFNKGHEEANRLMLDVHQKGQAVCGVYPHDTAMTKVMQVHDYARKNEAPLRCKIQKV